MLGTGTSDKNEDNMKELNAAERKSKEAKTAWTPRILESELLLPGNGRKDGGKRKIDKRKRRANGPPACRRPQELGPGPKLNFCTGKKVETY